jgi:hypothetical protein
MRLKQAKVQCKATTGQTGHCCWSCSKQQLPPDAVARCCVLDCAAMLHRSVSGLNVMLLLLLLSSKHTLHLTTS